MKDNNNSNSQSNTTDSSKEEEKKKNRKKMFIIIGIAIGLVIILIVILLLLLTFCRDQGLKGGRTTDITETSETAAESTETSPDTSAGTTYITDEDTAPSDETTAETEETTAETEETTAEVTEAPTINIYIVGEPNFSPLDEVCYYTVRADVTGIPEPDIDWSIDDSGGTIGDNMAQVNINDPGETRTLVATATNSEGSVSDSISISWGCNRPPEIQEITLMGNHYTDTEYTVSASATDPDGDILIYSWSVEGGTLYDEDINPVEWTTPGVPGFYDITVTVDDGNGGTDSLTENVEVMEMNNPPVVGSIIITEPGTGTIARNIYTGQNYDLSVEATDPDFDKLSYRWTATAGVITSSSSNPAQWKAPSSAVYCTITVTVDDGKGGTASNGIYVQVKTYVY